MTNLAELRTGTDVYSSDGHKLGELHRLVLRRSDLTLTHVVVDIGFLRSGRSIWQGGVGLDYDRVVPLDAVATASDDRIVLNLTAEQFKDAPEYTAEAYESPDLTPGEYDLPDMAGQLETIAAALGSTPSTWVSERLNKPLDGVDIVEGTPVWRRDPHQHVGNVSRALLDGEQRVQALVVRRGVLLKRDVVLPVRFIAELLDDIVRIDITDEQLEQLREHRD